MNNINRTLYIPLYGKALVSGRGIILHDPMAETIWKQESFALKAKSRSKWLAYYMSMRAAVFDEWLFKCAKENPDALILHLGCGLDSRCIRVNAAEHEWYDIDFPQVIEERKRFFEEKGRYHMLGADLQDEQLFEVLPCVTCVIVAMEGVSMYMHPDQLTRLFARLSQKYGQVHILMDCYTTFAAKASKYKNPVNDVGVTEVYGIDDPKIFAGKLCYAGEKNMTPDELIDQLKENEKWIFRMLYAGKTARKLYKLFEYHGGLNK